MQERMTNELKAAEKEKQSLPFRIPVILNNLDIKTLVSNKILFSSAQYDETVLLMVKDLLGDLFIANSRKKTDFFIFIFPHRCFANRITILLFFCIILTDKFYKLRP